jgi:hypothetical protein
VLASRMGEAAQREAGRRRLAGWRA